MDTSTDQRRHADQWSRLRGDGPVTACGLPLPVDRRSRRSWSGCDVSLWTCHRALVTSRLTLGRVNDANFKSSALPSEGPGK